jgi:hypothetical protein
MERLCRDFPLDRFVGFASDNQILKKSEIQMKILVLSKLPVLALSLCFTVHIMILKNGDGQHY